MIKMMMKVAIRVDASKIIGSGHVMRCLALAEGLRNSGAIILFIVRQNDTAAAHLIKNKEFQCKTLDSSHNLRNINNDKIETKLSKHSHRLAVDWRQDVVCTKSVLRNHNVDLLIVDHYTLNHYWESALRPHVNKIMVIDDLADRRHDCDVILDTVCGRKEIDYSDLSQPECRFLLGTKYALLRPEFHHWRNASLQRRLKEDTVRRILVSMGGVDMNNLTGSVLDQLSKVDLPLNCEINVVVGTEFPHIDELKEQICSFPAKLTLDIGVDDMARRIVEADLGIGAFGVSTWERCCLGLPSIDIITERNQRFSARALEKEKIVDVIFAKSLNDNLIPAIQNAIENYDYRRQLAIRSSELVDGEGVSRVVDWLETEL